jgi:hypothetical protein
MCAHNDNGLANEMRASKAMFGRWSAKGKTGLPEFLGVLSRMWCVLGKQQTSEEVKVMRLSHIVLIS